MNSFGGEFTCRNQSAAEARVFLECADLSALSYAAICRRKAGHYGFYLAATSRGISKR